MVVVFNLLQTLVLIFAKSLCLAEAKEEIFLLYDKAKYRIYVRKGEKTLLELPAGHGLRTFLPKSKKGDFLTPEGLYYIKEIRPSSLYYFFAELTYPNINDISFAYYRGDLNWEKLKEVWNGSTDSLRNILGYAIGIHGGGDGKREGTEINLNWTQGCIALSNLDLEVLLRFLKPMQKVFIIDSSKPLFEMLKKLSYPQVVKPLDFWEGALYFKINDSTFWYFKIKEEYKGLRYLLWEEWVEGRLNMRVESGLDGRFELPLEERLKETILGRIYYILHPMTRIDLELWK